MTVDAYTGLRRRKQTPWTVKFGDAFASKMIAVGGIGTIAAILLVVLVLLGTAWPLFQPPSRPDWHAFDFPAQRHVGLDEQQVILWGADDSGKIIAAAAHSGELIAEFPSPASDERKVTASSLSIEGTVLALGFSDGSFQCAELRFEQDLLNTADLPAEVEISEEKPVALHASAVYQRFDRTSVRRTQIVSPEWSAPRSLGEGPVTSIDFVGTAASKGSSPSDAYVAAIVGKEFAFGVLSRKKALIGKKLTETLAVDRCSIPNRDASRGPLSVTLLNDQEHAVIAWANGTLDRISLFDGKASLAESTSALVGDGKLTATSPLLARQTLLCGDSSGRVIGWNIVRRASTLPTTKPAQNQNHQRIHHQLASRLPNRQAQNHQPLKQLLSRLRHAAQQLMVCSWFQRTKSKSPTSPCGRSAVAKTSPCIGFG